MIESAHIFRRVVEQATDLIYILDLQLRVVWLNQHAIHVFHSLLTPETAARLSGTGADGRMAAFVGQPLAELFRPGDVAFVRRKMNQVLRRGDTVTYEHTIVTSGGQTHFSTKLIPIRNEEGQVGRILGITRDVTEKRELDQRIYNAEKLASIGLLAAGVAHEINNPLAVILGFTDLLLERFPPGTQEREDLKIIEDNAKTASRVVEQLLGFARVTEGMQDTLDVPSSVRTVMNIVRRTLLKRNIALEEEVPEELPAVRGDPREVQQVLFNLVNNAIAAMADGGRLTVRARERGDWVELEVQDAGVGIAVRDQPRVFDPFFTTKKVGEGTGLGLSLCYGIVSKYGGSIQFTSSSAEDRPDLPTGTTFTVSFPVMRGAARRQS